MKKLIASIIAVMLVMTLAFSALASYSVYAMHNSNKIYKEMDKNSKVLKKLEYGQKVKVIEDAADGWAKVSFKKKGKKREGWIRINEFSKNSPDDNATVMYTTKDGVKVYSEQDSESTVVKKFDEGKKLNVVETSANGKWYGVTYESKGKEKRGWVKAKYLTTKKPAATPTPKPTATATPKPGATATPKPEEAKKQIDSVLDSMTTVESYAAKVSTETADGTVALRWEPTKQGKLIAYLKNGNPLTVLAEGDGWFQVKDEQGGDTGFMSSKYISRVAFEVAPAAEPKTVVPLAEPFDVNALPDGVYPVSFDRAEITREDAGITLNNVHIYTKDVYDIVDITTLAPGDTLVVSDASIAVNSVVIKDDGLVQVNGGLDEGGCELMPVEEDNVYRVLEYDDLATYSERGVTTLVLTADATYEDSSDLSAEAVTAEGADILEAINGALLDSFDPYNTTVTVEAGMVVALNRVYTP